MDVDWRDPGNPARLLEMMQREASAKQRDRYRVVPSARWSPLIADPTTTPGSGWKSCKSGVCATGA